jgi:hypothetical protein
MDLKRVPSGPHEPKPTRISEEPLKPNALAGVCPPIEDQSPSSHASAPSTEDCRGRAAPDLVLLAGGLDQVLADPDHRRVVATIRAGRLVYRA